MLYSANPSYQEFGRFSNRGSVNETNFLGLSEDLALKFDVGDDFIKLRLENKDLNLSVDGT